MITIIIDQLLKICSIQSYYEIYIYLHYYFERGSTLHQFHYGM